MKFVRIEPVVEDGRHKGFLLDPEPYLQRLAVIQHKLPEGARRLATDEDHYNFFGMKCIKDLRLRTLSLVDFGGAVSLEIQFSANEFKHERELGIAYTDVIEFSMSKPLLPMHPKLGEVQLDEILPHERGFSHEFQMTGGSLWVVAGDLSFEWRDPLQVAE